MLKIEKYVTMSPAQYEMVIEGMRNPMNSWDKSDSYTTHIADVRTLETADFEWFMGEKDHDLAETLAFSGPSHSKYRRMMVVYLSVRAPLYWWKEFDTYKVGTVANSCSTMHKITAKPFELSDFSWENLPDSDIQLLEQVIEKLEANRQAFISAERSTDEWAQWEAIIKLLPSCYEQKRTIMLNYEVLANIYKTRKNHKLKEWHTFCDWIESLPYSELITGKEKKE